MPNDAPRIQLLHPDKGKSAPRLDKTRYDAFRKALLRAIPRNGEGVVFASLPGKVEGLLPKSVREQVGSVSWYVTTVKLDLEARGEIERVPGASPQHLRRPPRPGATR